MIKIKPEIEVKLLGMFNDAKFVAHCARISGIPDEISDEEIIEMIVENDYSSALEHIVFTFDITMTKLIAPEFLEHRIASHTARSTRFTESTESGYRMPMWVRENKDLYVIGTGSNLEEFFKRANEQIFKWYEELRKSGVPRDYARNILPMTTTTRYIWSINARSLINFLSLRLCERAYLGIRMIAKEVQKLVREACPEIFNRIDCRGYNLGVCPENNARPENCHHPEIPTKQEVKKMWKSSAILNRK